MQFALGLVFQNFSVGGQMQFSMGPYWFFAITLGIALLALWKRKPKMGQWPY